MNVFSPEHTATFRKRKKAFFLDQEHDSEGLQPWGRLNFETPQNNDEDDDFEDLKR